MTPDPLFDQAVDIVLSHEGGLTDDPNDPGGLTNYGFSLRENPDLTADDIRNMTRDQAIDRYYALWWVPGKYTTLPAPIAMKTFDLAVDIGKESAFRALQRALRACGKPVKDDGILGPETLKETWGTVLAMLMTAFKSELAAHYRIVAALHPEDAKFLPGWLERAYS